MKYDGRRKETIKNGLIILLGLVCLYGLTMNLRSIEASMEVVEAEEIETQTVIIEEKKIELEIDNLFESMEKDISEEAVSRVVMQVLGELYSSELEVKIEGKAHSYGITIIYHEIDNGQVMSEVKQDQIALVNASLLMSLFEDIDVVTTGSMNGDIYEEKVVYRLDLEDYFGISLEAVNNKYTFARVANEFLNSEAVKEYWNMKHPYDSKLGASVEKFYKYNFPSKWDRDEALPYIDETLGEDLVKEYGYKFFLQGLEYEHPLMNYYAAYRLIEYYGNSNLDEILLELGSCKNRTSHEGVRAACTVAMNILSSRLGEDEVLVFTRYSESILQGGEKLYALMGEEFIEIASWQGEGLGGFEVISVSDTTESVLCQIHTLDKSYLYILPIDSIGGYVVNEKVVEKGEQIISRELTELMKEIALNKEGDSKALEDIDYGDIQSSWLLNNVLVLSTSDEERFVYEVDKGNLLEEEIFNQRFDTAYLVQGLKEKFVEVGEKAITSENKNYEIKEIDLNGEKLLVYEYHNIMQKNRDILKEGQEEKQKAKQWSKGKIYVTYSGNQESVISTLNKLMA